MLPQTSPRPGDRVEVTGVFRAQARRVNPKITKVKSVYKTYVDAIHFRKVAGQTTNQEHDAPSSSHFAKDIPEEGGENQPGKGVRGDEVTHGSRFSPDRIAELEMRVSFQEHALGELSDALSESRMEVYRQSEQLRRALDELKAMRNQVPGDSGTEPPPPHY